MFVCNLLMICFVSLTTNKIMVMGEWVEIPQFADESKIFKFLSNKHKHFYKYSFNQYNVVPSYAFRNTSDFEEFDEMKRKAIEENLNYGIKVDSSTRKSFIASKTFSTIQCPKIIDDLQDKAVKIDYEVEQTQMEPPTKLFSSTSEVLQDDHLAIFARNSVNIPTNTTGTEKHWNETVVENKGFLEYLPIEVLRNVHEKLKSLPSTLKGKIRFFKQFEKNLMAEIESQLTVAIASTRRTRDTGLRYNHGYDGHDDDDIGFPSLEGALMTISFLTFAVYLVRLVMLLFRSNNNTAAVLLGRRKRSVDHFTNDVTMILNNVETFIYN